MIIPVYLLIYPPTQPVMVYPTGANLWWMLCLVLFCTVGLYLLQIIVLRKLSAFTVNLTYNLEPCYTVIIAFLAFGEARELNASFYMGISPGDSQRVAPDGQGVAENRFVDGAFKSANSSYESQTVRALRKTAS